MTVWGERISPVLDVARRAVLLTVRDGDLVDRREVELPGASGEATIAALSALGVELLLCGAVSRSVAERAASLGVRLVAFLAGDAEAVIRAHLDGQLPSAAFAMPGCRARRRRRGAGAAAANGLTSIDAERSLTIPNGDGTGPQRQGRGAGRGLGPCGGGRGQGKGPGGGRRSGAPAGEGKGT